MAELATSVHVADSRGEVHIFNPGDKVPQWAKDVITNPKVWAGEDVEASEPTSVLQSGAVVAAPEQPPLEGKGSGVKAWRDYAAAMGLGTGADASKDDILAALAGAPSAESDSDEDDDSDDESEA